jgi:hypothetical protein
LHFVKNALCKKLWSCRKTDCGVNDDGGANRMVTSTLYRTDEYYVAGSRIHLCIQAFTATKLCELFSG